MSSQPPIQLSDLSEPEQRLLSLAREAMPLAELALRLGVPVGDAARRLEALCSRLGVGGRDGLRALVLEAPPATEPTSAAPANTPEAPRRFSRRQILTAGVAGGLAVAAGGGALGYWATRGGSNGPAAGASPTATRLASASAIAATGLALIQPAKPDIAEVRTFSPGEEIDWAAGLFYMDAQSGEVEAWRLSEHGAATPTIGENAFTYPVHGGDIVLVGAGQPAPMYAVSRDRTKAWQWPSSKLSLMDRLGSYYLFQEIPADPKAESMTVHFADTSFRPISSISVNPRGQYFGFVLAPGGGQVVHADSYGADGTRIRLIDVATGTTVATYTFDTALGPVQGLQLFPLPGEMLVSVLRFDTDTNSPAMQWSRLRLPWTGVWGSQQEFDGPMVTGVSPDGRWETRTTFIDGAQGLGALYWSAVECYSEDGAQQFALLSASPPLWLGTAQWLADSSSFVIMNSAGKVDGPAWVNYAYSLVEPSGVVRPITMPALPPEGSPDYSPWMFSPTPSPTDSSLLALGTTGVLNLKTGTSVRANLGKMFPPPIGQPWYGRPNEVMFTLPVPGKDGPGVPFFINMKLTHGEIPTPPLHFTVARTGDCLNMRDAASLKGSVIGCIPDGTALTMADAKPTPDVPFGSWAAGDDGAWVYVSTAGGMKGWVAAPYLDWAV